MATGRPSGAAYPETPVRPESSGRRPEAQQTRVGASPSKQGSVCDLTGKEKSTDDA
jgi:hypothetical protein